MAISNVQSATVNTAAYPPAQTVSAAAAPAQEKPAAQTETYEPSAKSQETYKPDMNRVKVMWDEHNQQVDSFRRLIEGLLNKQGEKAGVADGWRAITGPISAEAVEMVEITEEARAAAQAEIDEGGYFSVNETAKRILDFAVAISGGDPSKVDVLEKAALRGFKQAQKEWGGEMPEISRQTMDAVKKGFDEWRQAGSASAITLLQ